MSRWRKRLFLALAHNAASPTEYVRLPADRTVATGATVAYSPGRPGRGTWRVWRWHWSLFRFALLLFLVEDRWRPLLCADGGARDDLHRYALGHPGFVTAMKTLSSSGSVLDWSVVFLLVLAWLPWRRLPGLAVFVAVTVARSSLLNTAIPTVVHRTRPEVVDPGVHERGLSFPGHSQAAVVGYGVLLLVFLPLVSGMCRREAVAVAVVMVLAIGFSRVALAAYYVSDVLAGYLLGAAWVAAMTALFSVWRIERGRSPVELSRGLEPDTAHHAAGEEAAPCPTRGPSRRLPDLLLRCW